MPHENILRKTTSCCPVCLDQADALILEKAGNIFLSKECPRHGKFELLLSETPQYYRNIQKFFFRIMDNEKKLSEYEMWVTMKCNMNCPICHLGKSRQDGNIPEPSLETIERFIHKNKASSYILSGGEPTCRKDLPEIIKIFKKNRKTVTMHTNGLKLVNSKYLRVLQESGLDRVNLQFDGFKREGYKVFRGEDLLDMKLQVLDNLKECHMPTDLNITIARGVNEEAIGDCVDFAVKNRFINSVNFFTICFLGEIKNWPSERYIMPDEVVDRFTSAARGKIDKQNIFLFQKLHLILKAVLKQRFCLYNQIYVLVRNKDGYEPIDKYLNLQRAEKWFDLYAKHHEKNKILAKIISAGAIPLALLKFSSFRIIKEMALTGFSYLAGGSYHIKSKKLLYVGFCTGCDPYKIDYGLIRNCQDEIIRCAGVDSELHNHGRDGLHFIGMEKGDFKA